MTTNQVRAVLDGDDITRPRVTSRIISGHSFANIDIGLLDARPLADEPPPVDWALEDWGPAL
jgi:hypothetical protein